MTTIAYRDRVMAADTMLTEKLELHQIRVGNLGRKGEGGGLHAVVDEDHTMAVGYAPKIIRLFDGSLLGMSGDAEGQFIINVLNSNLPESALAEALTKCPSECTCLLVRPSGQMVWVWTSGSGWAEYLPFVDKFAAIGTGRQFAYGAMEADKSAEEAVAIACRRTCYSGPPIQVVRLDDQ